MDQILSKSWDHHKDYDDPETNWTLHWLNRTNVIMNFLSEKNEKNVEAWDTQRNLNIKFTSHDLSKNIEL